MNERLHTFVQHVAYTHFSRYIIACELCIDESQAQAFIMDYGTQAAVAQAPSNKDPDTDQIALLPK